VLQLREELLVTDREILTKAMEEAVRNGYYLTGDFMTVESLQKLLMEQGMEEKAAYKKAFDKTVQERTRPSVIFDHSFAKSFWGDADFFNNENREQKDYRSFDEFKARTNAREFVKRTEWQYHLQQTVLAEEPLKYVEQFLVKEDLR
jgi:uncharacterized protein with von Willebrand factor type A (vWA) domain